MKVIDLSTPAATRLEIFLLTAPCKAIAFHLRLQRKRELQAVGLVLPFYNFVIRCEGIISTENFFACPSIHQTFLGFN